MKKLLLLCILLNVVLAGSVQAQCTTDANDIAIYWGDDFAPCETCVNLWPATVRWIYVVLLNSDQTTGVGGYEFKLVNDDGAPFSPPIWSTAIPTYIYPAGATNSGTEPEFIVDLATPIPPGPYLTLLTVEMFIMGTDPWCFGVSPVDNPSLTGQMSYYPGGNSGVQVPMNSITGPGNFTMACLNAVGCDESVVESEKSTWGSLKSIFR